MLSFKILPILSCFLIPLLSAQCVHPTGIKNRSQYSALPPTTPSPSDSVLFAHILLARPLLFSVEAPIQFHIIHFAVFTVYNAMTSFEPHALDIWARSPPTRFCSDAADFTLYRSLTLAYTCNFIFKQTFPSQAVLFDNLAKGWGIDPSRCTNSTACNDRTTPWGLAQHRLTETLDWLQRDGWNYDGALSRHFNRVPYEDWSDRPYVPRNSPWSLKFPRRWQPLRQHNGNGYLWVQEHVTPHIGHLARSVHVTERYACSLRAPHPRYNFKKELALLVTRSSSMAEDNVLKARIELFDNKLRSLNRLQASLLFEHGVHGDSWEFVEADMIGAAVLYEAVLVVWREKLRFDAVRPSTRLHSDMRGRHITAYAGPGKGRRRMLAEEWEPYVRTMPHSEYPSGSACFCTAFAEAMVEQFGQDEFRVGNRTVELKLVLEKGMSAAEPGSPNQPVELRYSRWNDAARECGLSRLDGGLHFTAAVTVGERLCAPLGRRVAQRIKDLSAGMKSAFVSRFDSALDREKRCGRERFFAAHSR